MVKYCQVCGNGFHVKPSRYNKEKFCSRACRYLPNRIILDGDIALVELVSKEGTPIAFAKIDSSDVEIVRGFSNRWYASWNPTTRRYQVQSTVRKDDGTPGTVFLHRFIMQAPTKLEVDHINRNSLDNRRVNLRICTRAENAQNLGLNRNNASGCRGVFWSQRESKWLVRLRVSGRNRQIGSFDRLEDAALAAKEARRKYMPYAQN